jgi:hypothetical protein
MNTLMNPQITYSINTNHNETDLKAKFQSTYGGNFNHNLLPGGFALAGWATATFGAPLVFIVGGLATAGIALLALAHPATCGLD